MADLDGINGQRKEFKVVGKPNLPGKLSYAIATGMAKFGADYVFPGMLHAKFLRSPHANATLKSVDVAAAKKIPGVVDILTWEDDDLKNFGRRGGGMMGMGGSAGPYIGNSANMEDEEVGVIVVSETEELCDEALKALNPQWEVRDHIIDILEGRKPDAPIIRPNTAGGGGGYGPMGGAPQNPPPKGNVSFSIASRGDIEAGFKEADQAVEYNFNMPAFCGHMPNPPASVSYWYDDPRYDSEKQSLRLEGAVWSASQGKDSVGGMYGLPPEKIMQEGLFQGGRYCDWGFRKAQEITPLLAKRVGRPVRMTLTRSEMYDFNMNQRFCRVKVGFKNNGLITAIDDFSIADAGVPPVSTLGTSGDQGYGPYFTTRCLNIKQSMEIVNSNRGKMYTSGQHCPFNWDSLTMAIHLIADKLGKDPIDIATVNLHGPADYTDPNPVPSYQACVEEGKKLMNWNWHATGAKKLPDGRMHGAGFRYQMCPRHSFSSYNSKLELRNGKVHMGTQGCCTGIFAVEGNAMVVAEELGLKYEDVSIDFDYKEPFAPVGGGSDGTTASAWVTKECANLLKKQILETAIKNASAPAPAPGMFSFGPPPTPLPFKGLSPADLDIKDGKIFVKTDPGKSVTLAQAMRDANLFATYSGKPPTALWATGPGKVIRLTSLEGQIHQVMDFSAGCQLQEDFFYDKKTGVKLNSNMFEYKKVSMLDMPPVDMKFLETRAGNAAYGSNGISHSLANTHLVICAIYNAIGKWVDPPASPDKVLKALGKA